MYFLFLFITAMHVLHRYVSYGCIVERRRCITSQMTLHKLHSCSRIGPFEASYQNIRNALVQATVLPIFLLIPMFSSFFGFFIIYSPMFSCNSGPNQSMVPECGTTLHSLSHPHFVFILCFIIIQMNTDT